MRIGDITNGSNTPKQQSTYLKKHAHYYGFRESPDGSRERYYVYKDKGFVVTEYGNEHEIVIASVRTCSVKEIKLIMMAKNLVFGE